MGDRYGRSDIDGISMGILIWNTVYRYGKWDIDIVIYHIGMVMLDISMEYWLMIWEMTLLMWSSPIFDMGYLVTLTTTPRVLACLRQGLTTLVHFSAQRKRIVWDRGCVYGV